ncbi:MAG TPA: YciI family protein, partial [Ramlibacter sp.]|nr:YciI family protein [Ramlibacter sp.]
GAEAEMTAYQDELVRAGVLLEAGSYALVQVRSREEALEWARRYPKPMGEGCPAEIEVRPLDAAEDLEQRAFPH